jgi:hypothetical protein
VRRTQRLRWFAVVLIVALFCGLHADLSAKGSSKSGSTGTKTVHVEGYTTNKGKHVAAYDRKAPEKKKEKTSQPTTTTSAKSHTSSSAIQRDENGRIERSSSARQRFMRQTGYPDGRPGYVVDHIRPLACGGADDASNMQWQTVEQAKAKDRVERVGC